MSTLLNLLLSLGFAAAVAGLFHLWRAQLDAARREGMQALAARRGWALTITGERLGRAGTLRIAPRGGLPWIAEVRPRAGRPDGFVTAYEADEPRWLDGTLILIAARPSEDLGPTVAGEDAARRLEALRAQALRGLLGQELARVSGQLSSLPAPEGLTALAAGTPQLRVDLQDLGRALLSWAPAGTDPREAPVLILSPEGMRLRLRRGLQRPEQMERFIDLAFDLGRIIGP